MRWDFFCQYNGGSLGWSVWQGLPLLLWADFRSWTMTNPPHSLQLTLGGKFWESPSLVLWHCGSPYVPERSEANGLCVWDRSDIKDPRKERMGCGFLSLGYVFLLPMHMWSMCTKAFVLRAQTLKRLQILWVLAMMTSLMTWPKMTGWPTLPQDVLLERHQKVKNASILEVETKVVCLTSSSMPTVRGNHLHMMTSGTRVLAWRSNPMSLTSGVLLLRVTTLVQSENFSSQVISPGVSRYQNSGRGQLVDQRMKEPRTIHIHPSHYGGQTRSYSNPLTQLSPISVMDQTVRR